MLLAPDSLSTAKTLIGRKDELDILMSAIDGADDLAVILLEGQGGMGKTRLLIEAGALCARRDKVLCTEVIDLLLTRNQQPARIMLAIALQLQRAVPAGVFESDTFQSYLKAQDDFYAARNENTDEQRARLEQAFLSDYRVIAGRFRIVLLLDTLEKLHPVIDDTEAFDFRRVGRLESWLARFLVQLPNTVVLLAGRPRERQYKLFADLLAERFRKIGIAPFTLDETDAYVHSQFASLVGRIPIDSLHTMSNGRPVVLAIALACIQHDAYDGGLPPGFEQQYPLNRESLSEAFVAHIMSALHIQHPGLAQLIEKAVYLRKGLRRPLLEQIARDEQGESDPESIMSDINLLSGMVFVKQIDEGEIILHDEMYELLLGKIGQDQSRIWWDSAITYLDQQIADTRQERNDQRGISGNSVSFARLQQKLQTLQIERMFYQMCVDPRQGYYNYRELSSNAIAAHDEDFDAQLQEELARFFDPETKWGQNYRTLLATYGISWDRLIYDESVRWVYRRIGASIPGTSPYQDALRLAERVRSHFPAISTGQDQGQELARRDLDAARLQAEVYTGAVVVQEYATLVADLDRLASPADQAGVEAEADARYAKFILANAYNYWGYFERTQERLKSAGEKYRQAIRLYNQLGPEFDTLRAVTLNNFGYALARQGESEQGLRLLDEALKIADHAGASYRVATARNTRAHLLIDLSRIDEAMKSMQQARRTFDDLKSIRDQALCANAEGRIRSRIAMGLSSPGDRDAEFQRAVTTYRAAINSFDAGGELIRRIETRLSLSKTYRDWASTIGGADDQGAQQTTRDMSMALLDEARALSTEQTARVIRAGIFEAMAVLRVDQGQYAQAIALLDQARSLLPKELRSPQSFRDLVSVEADELKLYWLRMAQIELQYALCAFGQGRNDDAISPSLRALAGLEQFSVHAGPIERFRGLIRGALYGIRDSAEIQRLRTIHAQEAAKMGVESSVFRTLDTLFEQAILNIDLLGS